MNKPQRRALPHYRHTQRAAAAKNVAATIALFATFTGLLIITMAITIN